MPEISRFFGIILFLYWKDHNPPHIHFSFGEYQCNIGVIDRVVDGRAPAKVVALVNKWLDARAGSTLSLGESTERRTDQPD